MGAYKILIKEALEHLFGLSDDLRTFNLYENGKLIVFDKNKEHVVMQFNSKHEAEEWLITHFEDFSPIGGRDAVQ